MVNGVESGFSEVVTDVIDACGSILGRISVEFKAWMVTFAILIDISSR